MPSADRILTARYTLAVNANVQPNGVKDLPQILRANSLTLTGSIDARDFRFIRDNMNKLVTLDLSGVSIAAYQGADGTLTGEHEYAANKVPAYAFRKAASGLSMTFSELKLPTTTVAIGEYALYNCSNVAGTLSIPASLDAFAISGMGSLSGVEFNGNVSAGGYIGDYAMQNVPLPEIFRLPASVETIGKHAFDGTAVDSVIMPGVKNIGNNAFTGTNVTSVSMPVVESIGDSAFMGTLLGDFLYFPQSLKKIGCHAFAGLEIESLMLPDTMEYIGAYAFAGCTALDYSYSTRFDAQNMLYIPEGIDTLAEGVFTDCAFNGGLKLPASLRRIVSSYEIPAFRGSSFNGDLNMENCTDIGAYAFAEAGFTGGKLYLAKGTKTIAEAVFSDCNFTGKLELSEGFEALEAAAFMNNIMLDTLILPASLDTLGFRAFYGCTGLRYIVNLASIPQMIAKDQNAGIYYDGWFGWSGDWNVAEEDLKQYPYYLNESQVFGEIPKQFKYLDLNPSDICKLIVPSGSVAAYQDAPAWGYWTMKYVEPLNITHDYQIALDAFDSIAGGGYYLSYKANNSLYGSIISTAKNYYLHEGCVTLTAISAGSIAFKNWTDRSGNILGTESTLTIIL